LTIFNKKSIPIEVEKKEKAQSAFKTGMDTGALQASNAQSAFKTATERGALQASKLIIAKKLNSVKKDASN